MNSNKFRNQYGYIEDITDSWLWVLLFGCLYFASKGVWNHFAISLILFISGFATCGITIVLGWVIYAFIANDIMRAHYLKSGWIPVENNSGNNQL